MPLDQTTFAEHVRGYMEGGAQEVKKATFALFTFARQMVSNPYVLGAEEMVNYVRESKNVNNEKTLRMIMLCTEDAIINSFPGDTYGQKLRSQTAAFALLDPQATAKLRFQDGLLAQQAAQLAGFYFQKIMEEVPSIREDALSVAIDLMSEGRQQPDH